MLKFEQGNYSKEAYDKTEENEASLRAEIAAAAASGSTDTILELSTRLQTLGAKKGEMIGRAKEEAEAEDAQRDAAKKKEGDYDEALEMNAEFDQAKAAAEAAQEKTRLAEEARQQAEEEAQKLAAVRARIKGGVAEEAQNEAPQSEQAEQSIENEPLNPLIQKYQENIEELFSQCGQLKKAAEESRQSGDKAKASDLERQLLQKAREIMVGGKETVDGSFVSKKEIGEKDEQFWNRSQAETHEYMKALNDSPQMILRLANETGYAPEFRSFSRRLLLDKGFIRTFSNTKVARNSYSFQVALRDNAFENYASQSRGY